MNWPIALLGVALLLSACSTLPTESQLVGTWTAPLKETTITSEYGVHQSYSKEVVDLTLASDHRLAFWVRGERSPDSLGHWHLDGRWLVTEFTRPKEGHRIRHSYRDRIIKLTQ